MKLFLFVSSILTLVCGTNKTNTVNLLNLISNYRQNCATEISMSLFSNFNKITFTAMHMRTSIAHARNRNKQE